MNKRPMALADLRPEVAWFALEMERRLRENDHKQRGGKPRWKTDSPSVLFDRLQEEVTELKGTLGDTAPTGGFDLEAAMNIAEEAADVANFAMMVFDQAAGDHKIPVADIDPPRGVQVVTLEGREVIHTVDVTGKSDSHVERVMAGMIRNLRGDCFVRDTADEVPALLEVAGLLTELEVRHQLMNDRAMHQVRKALNRLVLAPGVKVALVTADADLGAQYTDGCVVTEVVPERGGVLVDMNGDDTEPAGVGWSEPRVWPAS